MKQNANILSGSVFKGILFMAVPIMVMNVFQTLVGIIDMTVLRIMVNDAAVGAVGSSGMLISLSTGLLIGIASGATVIVARHVSRNEKEAQNRAIGTSILFAVISGILLMIIGFFGAKTLLVWINCPQSLIEDAALYFKMYFCSVPFMLLYNFSASILRANGETKKPMTFLLISGAVKIVLNVTITAAFDVTVEGVAVATIVSNAVAAALTFGVLIKGSSAMKFDFKYFKIYKDELKEILFIGVPAGLQSALYSLANTVISATVNTFGAAATTGISIANQFDGVLYQISIAPSYATVTYVSQNVAVGNIKRAKESIYKSIIITVMFGATFGTLSAVFSGSLSGIMSPNPEVIAFSMQKMMIISSTYFICGINDVMCSTMRGMGKPIIPTVLTFIYMCVLRFVWVYVIFPFYPNLTFLYLVWPIGWILSIVTTLFFYFPHVKKLEKNNSMLNVNLKGEKSHEA